MKKLFVMLLCVVVCCSTVVAQTVALEDPDTTIERIVWITASLTLLGAGVHTMAVNEDATTEMTGSMVAAMGATGLIIYAFEF